MMNHTRISTPGQETLPAVEDMYVYMDAANPNYSNSSGFTCISTGDTWSWRGGSTIAPATTSSLRGSYYSCRSNIFDRSGGDFSLSTNYMTIIALTRVQTSASGSWRTLVRSAVADHHVIVENGGTRMGMYDNNGSGFNITNPIYNVPTKWDTDWQILCWEIQSGASPYYRFRTKPSSGSLYDNTSSTSGLTNGFAHIGGYQGGTFGSQFWGDLAVFACWDRFLTSSEKLRAEQVLEKRIL